MISANVAGQATKKVSVGLLSTFMTFRHWGTVELLPNGQTAGVGNLRSKTHAPKANLSSHVRSGRRYLDAICIDVGVALAPETKMRVERNIVDFTGQVKISFPRPGHFGRLTAG